MIKWLHGKLSAARQRQESFRIRGALEDTIERNRRETYGWNDEDAKRLMALLKKVGDRIGGACVTYNDSGEVFMHPVSGARTQEAWE
jgi:hypothetical protein